MHDTLTGDCQTIADIAASRSRTDPTSRLTLLPLDLGPASSRLGLATLYLQSYPPGIGATTIDEALADVDATAAGEYGVLVPASVIAVDGTTLVGSIQVVHRSPWDPSLDHPFVIELFVAPRARGRGVGTALIGRAAALCLAAGESRLSLRVGEGTSAAATRLYSALGMRVTSLPTVGRATPPSTPEPQ